MAPISKADLDKRLSESLSHMQPGDINAATAKLQEHMKYCSDHYSELDSGAKVTVDAAFDSLHESMGQIIEGLPDGHETRRAIRLHAQAGGKHYRIIDVMAALEAPPAEQLKTPFSIAARSLFEEGMQQVSDFLFDISRHTHASPHNICFILSFQCMDELLAAMHLAGHAYCGQAYAHVRAVHECLDKIELFAQQPHWIELWTSGDEKRIQEELRPAEVRRKLGSPRYDPLYGFLSRLGSHASFDSLKSRIAFETGAEPGTTEGARVWYGGTRQLHHILWSHFQILHALTAVLLKVAPPKPKVRELCPAGGGISIDHLPIASHSLLEVMQSRERLAKIERHLGAQALREWLRQDAPKPRSRFGKPLELEITETFQGQGLTRQA